MGMRSKTITVDHAAISKSIQHIRDIKKISQIYIKDWEQYFDCQYVRYNRRKNTSVIKFRSENDAIQFALKFL